VLLGRTGANDPDFNLISEPLLLLRRQGTTELFAAVIEPHGYFSEALERSQEARGRITDVRTIGHDEGVLEITGATAALDGHGLERAGFEHRRAPRQRWRSQLPVDGQLQWRGAVRIDLKGKVAVVTGGGRDIGRAVSLGLAGAGAAVVVNYFDNPADAAAVVGEIEACGGRALAVQADVTNPVAVGRLVQKPGGHSAMRSTSWSTTPAAWRTSACSRWMTSHRLFGRINFKSVAYVCRAVIPFMPPGSAIVNLSSLAAHDGGGPGATMYAAGKGAVLTLTRGLAKELGPQKIRVNCVSPGMINTTFHNTFTKPEARLATAARTCVGREGEAVDVANAIVFLASDAAAYITGESLEINGGLYFV
jgi:3-oxoacyl-[acyl-carrier protein] reductase